MTMSARTPVSAPASAHAHAHAHAHALALLAGLLALSALISLGLGAVALDWGAVWQGARADAPNWHWLVFWELRVPRTVLAILVGAALGLSGALLQGWTRNPLAEPGLLGTSACASLGSVLAIHSGLYAAFALALPLAGFAAAALGALVMLLFVGRLSLLGLILAGIGLQSFAGALLALALNLAPDPHSALEIAFWLLGSVSERSQAHVWLVLPFWLAGAALALRQRMALDALSLGEETAFSLGVRVARARAETLLAVALMVGPAVAVAGAIGFVGLVVPHLLRLWLGARPSALLGASLLGGALLLLWADVAVRLLPSQAELKLGVMTGLIGCPIFFWMLWRLRAHGWGDAAGG